VTTTTTTITTTTTTNTMVTANTGKAVPGDVAVSGGFEKGENIIN